jgi:hypothetical protein
MVKVKEPYDTWTTENVEKKVTERKKVEVPVSYDCSKGVRYTVKERVPVKKTSMVEKK